MQAFAARVKNNLTSTHHTFVMANLQLGLNGADLICGRKKRGQFEKEEVTWLKQGTSIHLKI
jgi:hypothetical protein